MTSTPASGSPSRARWLPLLALALAPSAAASPAPAPASGGEVHVEDYLPAGHVVDGTVDYTDLVQAALHDAAGGTLVLPDHPVLVARQAGVPWCLEVPSTVAVVGSPSAVLREELGGAQILRVEDALGVRFEGFTLEGSGRDGHGLAQGLLQVSRGRDVTIRGVTVRGGDADGIAVADVEHVSVLDCRAEDVSKSSIYLSDCTNGLVRGNVVTGFGGHTWGTPPLTIGTGIQLSGGVNVTCSENVVSAGTGVGILCNALTGGRKPSGNVLVANRIEGVANPTNLNFSGGIRCNNGNPDKRTNTLVAHNSVRACGAYGIYVNGHGGSAVLGNTVVESQRSGIFVGTVADLEVAGNTVLNTDLEGVGQQAGLLLFNGATRVTARGNLFGSSPLYLPGKGTAGALDFSTGGGHDLEPRVLYAAVPPASGKFQSGDRVYDTRPEPGGHLGWICVSTGNPGRWVRFGKIAEE